MSRRPTIAGASGSTAKLSATAMTRKKTTSPAADGWRPPVACAAYRAKKRARDADTPPSNVVIVPRATSASDQIPNRSRPSRSRSRGVSAKVTSSGANCASPLKPEAGRQLRWARRERSQHFAPDSSPA